MSRGGFRPNSGPNKGGGKWKGIDTKPVRLPIDYAEGIEEIVMQLLFQNSEKKLDLAELTSWLQDKVNDPMIIRSRETSNSSNSIPEFWGKVAATPGVTSFDNETISEIDIHAYLVKNPSKTLAFRVSGDSMVDAGIHNDALLIIELLVNYPFEQPEHNDIIVAEVHDEIVVKRYQKQNSKTFLVSENKAKNYPPIPIKKNTPFRPIGIVKSSTVCF